MLLSLPDVAESTSAPADDLLKPSEGPVMKLPAEDGRKQSEASVASGGGGSSGNGCGANGRSGGSGCNGGGNSGGGAKEGAAGSGGGAAPLELTDCLKAFVRPERLDGANCYWCASDGSKTHARTHTACTRTHAHARTRAHTHAHARSDAC